MKIAGITLVLAILSLGIFSQYNNNTAFGVELNNEMLCHGDITKDTTVALLQDRKEGFEDGEGPNYQYAISQMEDNTDRNLSDIELEILLTSAQGCIDYWTE